MKTRILVFGILAGMLALIWWPKPNLPFGTTPERWKDALHAPFFAIVTLLIFALLPGRWKVLSRILIALAIVMIVSPLTEFIQPLFNRSASFSDLFANTIGIIVAASGLWVYRARSGRSGWKLKILHAIACVALMLFFLKPVILEARARVWLSESFPELSRFEDRRAAFFWISQGEAELKSDAGLMEIETRPGNWSGVSFFPGVQDWSDRTTLVLEIENPGEPFQIGVRIDDDQDGSPLHSRYNGFLDLPAGAITHRIPLEQIASNPKDNQLNLSAITRLALFAGPDGPPRVFFLKRAFLE